MWRGHFPLMFLSLCGGAFFPYVDPFFMRRVFFPCFFIAMWAGVFFMGTFFGACPSLQTCLWAPCMCPMYVPHVCICYFHSFSFILATLHNINKYIYIFSNHRLSTADLIYGLKKIIYFGLNLCGDPSSLWKCNLLKNTMLHYKYYLNNKNVVKVVIVRVGDRLTKG